MQGSKIHLSPAEAALFQDAEVILTKNSILQKAVSLLGNVETELLQRLPGRFKNHTSSAKISKGENYLGLPYVVLDFPRLSTPDDFCFVRSMFWWGNFYSSTLQISGSTKTRSLQTICEAWTLLRQHRYSVGINADPWIHHFGADNYLPVAEVCEKDFHHIAATSHHLKLAAHWPVDEWNAAEKNLVESWTQLISLVA